MGKGISLSDLPEPYRRQAEHKLIQEMQRRAVLKPKTETANPENPKKRKSPSNRQNCETRRSLAETRPLTARGKRTVTTSLCFWKSRELFKIWNGRKNTS